jgi:hypothetical protein
MKKKNENIHGEGPEVNQENSDELNELIRRKDLQNKILKELMDQLKKYPVHNPEKPK